MALPGVGFRSGLAGTLSDQDFRQTQVDLARTQRGSQAIGGIGGGIGNILGSLLERFLGRGGGTEGDKQRAFLGEESALDRTAEETRLLAIQQEILRREDVTGTETLRLEDRSDEQLEAEILNKAVIARLLRSQGLEDTSSEQGFERAQLGTKQDFEREQLGTREAGRDRRAQPASESQLFKDSLLELMLAQEGRTLEESEGILGGIEDAAAQRYPGPTPPRPAFGAPFPENEPFDAASVLPTGEQPFGQRTAEKRLMPELPFRLLSPEERNAQILENIGKRFEEFNRSRTGMGGSLMAR